MHSCLNESGDCTLDGDAVQFPDSAHNYRVFKNSTNESGAR